MNKNSKNCDDTKFLYQNQVTRSFPFNDNSAPGDTVYVYSQI